MSLSRDMETKGQDSRALAEYVGIMGGVKDVKPYDEADENHIATHRKQLITSEFIKAKPDRQARLLKLVEAEINSFELRSALDVMSKPPEEPQQPPQPQGMPPAMPGQMPGQPPIQGQPPMLPPGGGMGVPNSPMNGAAMPPMGSPGLGAPVSPPVDQLINQVLMQVNPAERMELSQVLNPEMQPVVDMTDPNNLNLV